ncbi:hypothetical protein QBC38DRAFT_454687 [Podospora fimiseda]|uniref:Uncharacterized protein n=1 Tax=Podospora fimiseda TaxID=252190 RepID=A0AAN7BR37_9PEZI|nr:hypothetical protein QBC38DRAFT_454687 [Podospora fimiseda]
MRSKQRVLKGEQQAREFLFGDYRTEYNNNKPIASVMMLGIDASPKDRQKLLGHDDDDTVGVFQDEAENVLRGTTESMLRLDRLASRVLGKEFYVLISRRPISHQAVNSETIALDSVQWPGKHQTGTGRGKNAALAVDGGENTDSNFVQTPTKPRSVLESSSASRRKAGIGSEKRDLEERSRGPFQSSQRDMCLHILVGEQPALACPLAEKKDKSKNAFAQREKDLVDKSTI